MFARIICDRIHKVILHDGTGNKYCVLQFDYCGSSIKTMGLVFINLFKVIPINKLHQNIGVFIHSKSENNDIVLRE